MIREYTTKPVSIEAVLLEPTQKSIKEVLRFMDINVDTDCNKAVDTFETYCLNTIDDGYLTLDCFNGLITACFGDYIIKDGSDFYKCWPDKFKLTYDIITQD